MNAPVRPSQFDSAPYEQMSATTLSLQPTTIKLKPRNDPAWTALFTHLESRLGSLRSWRWSWWVYWRILAQFFDPKRYEFLVVANRFSRGSPVNDSIVDSTGQLGVRTCASGMWTGLTSPSRPWFKMDIGLPWVQLDADGKAWLEDTQQRVYTVLHQSNFYSVMAQAFADVTVFGTAPVLILEDAEDVIRLYLPCAGEYYLAVGARLHVNTFLREFTLTVEQIVEMFTLESCPQAVVQLWTEAGAGLDTEFVVCHMIEPNFDISARGGAKRDKIEVVPHAFTYREVYWLKGMKTDGALSKRGFHEQPFFTLRGYIKSNDAYGRSFCMDALGDTKQIQLETMRKAEFIEKGVRPPMGANPELKNEPSSIIPGNITYMDTSGGKKGFFPLFEPHPQWLPALTADIKEVQGRINHCLFVELFMAITRMEGVQPRNELELTKRDLERLQELGPVVELAEKELSIAINRILAILQRRKMLKPLPQSLHSVPLKITYLSIMRLAQRNAEAVAMKDVFATMGNLSAAAKAAGVPDPLRVINLDESARHFADISNYPINCTFTKDEVSQHDQIRAQEQQKVQASSTAMGAVNAAKTLSETPLDQGTALGRMLGPGVTGPPG
jgi:hypothetical protein